MEGTAVDVITCTVGDDVNIGMGNGVGCGLQAERINKINPMNWNFFIRIFLWNMGEVDYIPARKIAKSRWGLVVEKGANILFLRKR
jgi:hypothetical protein